MSQKPRDKKPNEKLIQEKKPKRTDDRTSVDKQLKRDRDEVGSDD